MDKDKLFEHLKKAKIVMKVAEQKEKAKHAQTQIQEQNYTSNNVNVIEQNIWDENDVPEIPSYTEHSKNYNNKVANSNLPDSMKTIFLEKPIVNPVNNNLVLSEDVVHKFKNNKILSEQKLQEVKKTEKVSLKQIENLIENKIEEILDKKLKNILKEEKENLPKEKYSVQLKIGDYLFEGEIKPIKKLK